MSSALTATHRTPAGLAPHTSDFHAEKEEHGNSALRDTPRRVTPAIIDFHKKLAHALRAECQRDIWPAVWALLKNIARR